MPFFYITTTYPYFPGHSVDMQIHLIFFSKVPLWLRIDLYE